LLNPAVKAPADALRVGGFVPFSSVDWPGRLAAVLFVQGCPWRCAYCHNPHLQSREASAAAGPAWPELRAWLQRRHGLIDGMVFSGGEPTLDPAIVAAAAELKSAGFAVGLHTAGIYPARLQALLPHLDWVGLDVKAPLDDDALHDRITGRAGSVEPVRTSLALLQRSGIDFECRTTAHPTLLDAESLCAVADGLAGTGTQRWALQIARPAGRHGLAPVQEAYPGSYVLAHAQSRMAVFTLRRE
jgi:pyruvate formate lyase activating enzyme